MRRPNAILRSLKLFLGAALSIGWLSFRWSVALIMTRSLCPAPHLWRCYLFRAATDTAIVPTNTRLEKTLGGELLCSQKLWLLWRRDRNRSNRRLSRSLCCQTASDFGVTRFNH